MTYQWQRHDAEVRIRELLDAAKTRGPQTVQDKDGTFNIVYTPNKMGLEQLFSQPGPLRDDDLDF
ncbi:hypothetical protein [Agrobacterium sp. NPDC090273]|uniref:hypothetical protein n=1 Tax=Agrobacterium sp. NPDC090273 TaxID=3363919 RepID=UPI00383A0F98